MPTHVQIRLISLLEEAANSFEQLETLANRTLAQIPGESIEEVELRSIERDYVNDENEPGSEMDHVVFIRYRTDKVEDALRQAPGLTASGRRGYNPRRGRRCQPCPSP